MPRQNLIEPVPIEDDLCSELALIEAVELGARFVLVHRQTCYESGEQVLVVKRKIILPLSAIPDGVELTLGFLGRRAVTVAGRGLLRLVR